MKNNWVGLFLSLILFCPEYSVLAASQQVNPLPEVWTIENAIRYALAGNPDSTIARTRIEKARVAATMAKSTDYPKLNLSSEYGQTNNPMYSFGNILNQGAFTNDIDFNSPGRTDNFQLRAELNYRLYKGGRDRAAQDTAQADIAISQIEMYAVHQHLAFEVVKSCHAIIHAEKMVTVREGALDSISAALDVGKARYEAGDLLKQDLLNLELQQSRASENLIESKHRLELTKRGFLNLLGLSKGNVSIDPESGAYQQLPESIDYKKRHELRMIERLQQKALAELRMAQGARLPSLDAFASYQVDNGFILDESGDSWMAGIRLNYVLFDGRKISSELSSAKLRLQEIQAIQKKTELALELEVQQALLDYQQAQKRLTVTEKMVGVAEEVIRLGRAQFSEGAILASDLIDYEMRLSDAQARQIAAIAGYRVAIANLRRATGLEQYSNE